MVEPNDRLPTAAWHDDATGATTIANDEQSTKHDINTATDTNVEHDGRQSTEGCQSETATHTRMHQICY